MLLITQACLCRLNEGHTEFVERMVVSRVRAIDNTEPFRHFLAIDGLRALSYQIGWKIAFYLVSYECTTLSIIKLS